MTPWQQARRVLAVRLDNLGDVLMTTPALAALQQGLPLASITMLCSASGTALLPHLPFVDEAIVFEAPWVGGGQAATPFEVTAERQMLEKIAAARFDAAVIFTVCTQSALPAALFCRLAGIPTRLAHARENPYGLLTHWVPDGDRPVDGARHEVQRQLDLVASIGCKPDTEALRFELRAGDVANMWSKLAASGCDAGRPYFVVHPGATAASRRYPAVSFARAAALVAERSGHQAVFVGSASEAALAIEARAGVPGRSVLLVDSLTLGELAALLAGASVTLCNNSAPAHLAAAVGGKVVVLYALTNPQHTPWLANSRVLSHAVPCRNCLKSICPQQHHACLRGVDPAHVADAALDLMASSHRLQGVGHAA